MSAHAPRRAHDFRHLYPSSVEVMERPMSTAEIQSMWTVAFERAGVDFGRPSAGRPARPGGAQAQWDRALARAGLIMAEAR